MFIIWAVAKARQNPIRKGYAGGAAFTDEDLQPFLLPLLRRQFKDHRRCCQMDVAQCGTSPVWPRCAATRDEEQAVSVETQGPCIPKE